jgi:hypothetical protein
MLDHANSYCGSRSEIPSVAPSCCRCRTREACVLSTHTGSCVPHCPGHQVVLGSMQHTRTSALGWRTMPVTGVTTTALKVGNWVPPTASGARDSRVSSMNERGIGKSQEDPRGSSYKQDTTKLFYDTTNYQLARYASMLSTSRICSYDIAGALQLPLLDM